MSEDTFFSAAFARSVRPLPTLMPACDRCGLYRSCNSPKMLPAGQGRRRVLLVSDYPGADEDASGEPLTGRMGQWLGRQFDALGWNMRRDCTLTNALICHPGGEPPETAVGDCRPNLLRTIRETTPDVILLAGSRAVASLVGHLWQDDIGSISRWVGWRIPCRAPNAWVCPMNSPAYLMRQEDPVLDNQFRRHLKDALALAGSTPWPDGVPDDDAKCDVIHDPEDAAARIRVVRRSPVAFDYETNCLKPEASTSEIVCASICDGRRSFAFPWCRPTAAAMRELLTDSSIGKVGANCSFEDRWTRAKLGMPVRGWVFDTMLAAHCLDPRGGCTGVKFCAFVHLGVPPYNRHLESFLESDHKGGYELNRVRDISPDLLMKYCALDSLHEYQLARIQSAELGIDLGIAP